MKLTLNRLIIYLFLIFFDCWSRTVPARNLIGGTFPKNMYAIHTYSPAWNKRKNQILSHVILIVRSFCWLLFKLSQWLLKELQNPNRANNISASWWAPEADLNALESYILQDMGCSCTSASTVAHGLQFYPPQSTKIPLFTVLAGASVTQTIFRSD